MLIIINYLAAYLLFMQLQNKAFDAEIHFNDFADALSSLHYLIHRGLSF